LNYAQRHCWLLARTPSRESVQLYANAIAKG
jgi:hypothetical protein